MLPENTSASFPWQVDRLGTYFYFEFANGHISWFDQKNVNAGRTWVISRWKFIQVITHWTLSSFWDGNDFPVSSCFITPGQRVRVTWCKCHLLNYTGYEVWTKMSRKENFVAWIHWDFKTFVLSFVAVAWQNSYKYHWKISLYFSYETTWYNKNNWFILVSHLKGLTQVDVKCESRLEKSRFLKNICVINKICVNFKSTW